MDSELNLGNIIEIIVDTSDVLLDFMQPWQRSSKIFLMTKKEGPMFGPCKSHYVKEDYGLPTSNDHKYKLDDDSSMKETKCFEKFCEKNYW